MQLQLTLAVADLDRSESFYRNLLCLPLQRFAPGPQFPELLCLQLGEQSVLLRQQEDLAASHPAIFEPIDRHPKGIGVTLELAVKNLEQINRRLDQQQLHTLYELEDAEHHRRELWLHDPDGYLLMLVEEERNQNHG